MPPRKTTAKSPPKQTAQRPRDATKLSTPRIPRVRMLLRYVLLVLCSLSLGSILYTYASEYTDNQLESLSNPLEEGWEVGALVAWRGVELGLSWAMGFNGRPSTNYDSTTARANHPGYDIASFIFLTHLPTYTLLAFFYKINLTTILSSNAILLTTTTLPYVLFRRYFNDNNNQGPTPGILQDRLTNICITFFATALFSVILYTSYATWLPAQLVVHFPSLPDVSITHVGAAEWPVLFLSCLPAGYAAKGFVFDAWARVSAADSSSEKEENERERHGEYLICALYRNTWGKAAPGTRVLVSRTAALVSMTLLNTLVQLVGTVRGVEVEGALVWGGVWVAACAVVGTAFGWIAAVDGV